MEKFTFKLTTAGGVTIDDAFLAYKTLGDKSKPCILAPTCYGGKLDNTLTMIIGDNNALSPRDYFIVVVGLLGGSESSSPSTQPKPFNGPNFPKTTYEDNIRSQYKLLQYLGVNKLFAYVGFSMGAMQAYHFATIFPDKVDKIVALAGSARCSMHNWSFLEGPKSCLLASEGFNDGKYTTNPTKGTRAFGRVYSTWALCPEWFEAKNWEKAGCKSHDEYLTKNWEGGLGDWDANDLLQLIYTWQTGDIGIFHGGDYSKALQSIQADCLIMPSRTDQYFRYQDSEKEVKELKHGRLSIIESIYGHLAGGGGGTDQDADFINGEIRKFFK